MLSPTSLRSDFPILGQTIHDGKRLAYLDNAATTQKPVQVIEAIRHYYEFANANVHRALHELASRATEGYEAGRSAAAKFIGAPTSESMVLTRGTTEGINLVAHAWGRRNLKQGDAIVLSEMEHHSNLVPWQMLAQERGLKLLFVDVLPDGTLNREAYSKHLSAAPKLVALAHMSNVLGTINPVKELASEAHAAGALFLCDGAQSVPHMPVNVMDLDVDFLAFSGHKMCAPTGIGGLYIRPELVEYMNPFMGGGEMILRVTLEESSYAEPPHRFEAGTPNIEGSFGLKAAIDYLNAIGMENIHRGEEELTAYAIAALEEEVPGLTVYGKAPERGGAISFSLKDIHPHDIAQFVDRYGVAIRAGHHCAQPLMRKLGVPATARASLYFYNTREDVDQLVDALLETIRFFNG